MIGFVIGLLAGVVSISFFWVAEIRRVERMLEEVKGENNADV